jgi:hypothetical protein
MIPNISLESSESERPSANLYQRIALDKNSHKKVTCIKCSTFFCKMESFSDHSKKYEIYRCRYYFSFKLDNVIIVSEENRKKNELKKDEYEGSKGKRIKCAKCRSFLGFIADKEQKCSCLVKVKSLFKINANMVCIQE